MDKTHLVLTCGLLLVVAIPVFADDSGISQDAVSASGGTISGPLLVADGTKTAPSLANTGDTDTGLFWGADNTISFSTGNTLRLAINSAGLIQIAGATGSFPAIKRSAAAIAFRLADDASFTGTEADYYDVLTGAVNKATLDTTGLALTSDTKFVFWSGTDLLSGAADVGLARAAAAVIKLTNGSTGAGSLRIGTDANPTTLSGSTDGTLGDFATIGTNYLESGGVSILSGANRKILIGAAGPVLASDAQYKFSSTTLATGSVDTGFARLAAATVKATNGTTGLGKLIAAKVRATIAADDTTPSVANAEIFITSNNTVGTAITDLDDPTVDQIVTLCGDATNDANDSTIADAANFTLTAAITLDPNVCITLWVRADNDYVEQSRSAN